MVPAHEPAAGVGGGGRIAELVEERQFYASAAHAASLTVGVTVVWTSTAYDTTFGKERSGTIVEINEADGQRLVEGSLNKQGWFWLADLRLA